MFTYKDLKVGEKYLYKEDTERCVAKVLKIDEDKKEVTFIDGEDFEWPSPFDEIPETIVKKL